MLGALATLAFLTAAIPSADPDAILRGVTIL
jgi:hypothetical protein